jgi:hypothetical protein
VGVSWPGMGARIVADPVLAESHERARATGYGTLSA